VSLSAITPRWDHFVSEKQAQGFRWFSVMEVSIKITCN